MPRMIVLSYLSVICSIPLHLSAVEMTPRTAPSHLRIQPFSQPAVIPYGVDANTIALWHLDETSGAAVIDSAGVNNGSAFGETAIVPGRFHNARYFRGNGSGDYLGVPDNPTLRDLSSITIEAWVNPGPFPYPSNPYRESIVQKGDAHDPYNLYLLGLEGNADGTFRFEFAFVNDSQRSPGADPISPVYYQPNQWYYVVGTYDGSVGRLYVNGQLVAEDTPRPGITVTNTDPLFINNNTYFRGQSHNGLIMGIIDEVRISNAARSATEILSTYEHATTTPPVLTLPPDQTVEATGLSGATVTFTASANDFAGGPIPVVCTPASGTTFALGTTTVYCSASDSAGNTATGNFLITVRDTTPPALTLHNVVLQTNLASAVVNYTASAIDAVDGSDPVSFTPVSGATFPLGITAVLCTTTDHAGNSATGTFTITVVPPPTANGSFSIGDLNAGIGNRVTFWGAQWAKANSLSGGPAPASFKGFVESVKTALPSCGQNWTSNPGNSSGPPSSITPYIAAIVSSSVTQSGSTVSGDVQRVVIIKTAGYASNPGHAGKGTVVAVICP